MKKITFSVSLVALMLVSSVLTAQEISTVYNAGAGCSSCGQQSFVEPVSFNQPIVAATTTFAQPIVAATPTFAQPITAGCSSCGTAAVAAPIETSFVSQPAPAASCCAAPKPARTSNCCCSSRGGFLRGGRSGGFGGAASSRLIRSGIIGAIRD